MIGSKSIGALALLTLALAIAAAGGVLSTAHLGELSAKTCLVIGVFAGLATPLVTLGWRPAEPSSTGLRVRRQRRQRSLGDDPIDDQAGIWDLPALGQRASFVLIFLCLGLVAFGNREAELLTSAPSRIAAAGSEYCPPPGQEPAVVPAAKPAPVADVRGCALIKRAYALGYAKSLGACAPVAPTEAPAQEQLRAACTKRQHDEPYWHWTWRQFNRNSGDLKLDPVASLRQQTREFKIRWGYVDTAVAQQAHAINADPRAAHHIFTNLPAPTASSWLRELWSPTPCHTRYRDLPAYPGSTNASVVFEHAFARLLFDTTLGTAAGFCHDYTIHWGASSDLCQQLVANPRGVLDAAGVLENVRAVLDRRVRQRELRALARDLGRDTAIGKPAPAAAIVSFQCYMHGQVAGGRQRTRNQIRIDGVDLGVRELIVAAPESSEPKAGTGEVIGVASYNDVFQLLVGDSYSGAAGEVEVTGLQAPPTPTDILDTEFRLARMELLADQDPFVGADWASARAELRPTYPLHLHLHNFTEVFRNRYRRERGRL